jgi:hypothetical protein
MTIKLAVLGDRTSNGKIISATANYFSEGRQVAQNNDKAICTVCREYFPSRPLLLVSSVMAYFWYRIRTVCFVYVLAIK